ncbi:MAG: DUF305 domain-containing protein [Minisyncoccia bacterium]
MNDKIAFGAGGILIGAIIVLLLSSTGQYRSMMGRVNNSNNTNSSGTFGMMNNIDAHFIEQMIPHHDGAIEMAKLALQKAKRPEIKTLAQKIISAQEKEVIEMQSWYKSWFGGDVKKGNTYSMMGGMMSQGGMHMVGSQQDTQTLENATDFDKAFIENMISHHQLAIIMAQMLKAGTNRQEMLTLSNNITESQSKEIEQMESWYKNWYK